MTRSSIILGSSRRMAAIALAAAVAFVPSFIAVARTDAHTTAATSTPRCSTTKGLTGVPAIAFGRAGGNIRPMTVKIFSDGTISYQGALPRVANYGIDSAAVLGLQRLAAAEGFATMPAVTNTPGTLPDIAAQFISVRASCTAATKTVRVHGLAPAGFAELYATLQAATALSTGPSQPLTAATATPPISGGAVQPRLG